MRVVIYERMPSPARKFLLAGRGGLNLTHSEAQDVFLTRYGAPPPQLVQAIAGFTPAHLRDWSVALGEADLRRIERAGLFPRASRPRRWRASGSPGWPGWASP